MEKYIIKKTLIIFFFFIEYASSQVQLNNNKCFKIELENNNLVYRTPNYFVITNNTNNNYILNIDGFSGDGKVYENGKKIIPYLPEILSIRYDWDAEECKNNILIIPKKIKLRTILYLSLTRGYYKIDPDKKYEIDFENMHTKKSPYYYGCKDVNRQQKVD